MLLWPGAIFDFESILWRDGPDNELPVVTSVKSTDSQKIVRLTLYNLAGVGTMASVTQVRLPLSSDFPGFMGFTG